MKPEGAWNEAVPGREEYFGPGPRQFAVCGPDADRAVYAVGLAVLRRGARPIAKDVGPVVL